MKIKLKFNLATTIRYIYIIILLLNLLALYQIFVFTNKYLYKTFVMDKHILENAATVKSNDLNVTKFETVIDEIGKKQQQNNSIGGTNPFD